MRDVNLYEKIIIYDEKMPFKLIHTVHDDVQPNQILFSSHWHEHLELWYLKKGKAIISHGGLQHILNDGDLSIANSNELHSGYAMSNDMDYFCIIIDPKFFSGEIPHGHFMFENFISGDDKIKKYFEEIFEEYQSHAVGFDMAIKAQIYEMLVYLLRNHIYRRITLDAYISRSNKLERIKPVMKYIENNYNDDISYAELAKLLNVSKYHFCHLFKEATGKTVVQYINDIRLDKAYNLLKNTDMNITQVSMSVGFNDMNYFSRLFKKYKNMAPSKVRNVEK